MTDPSVHGIPGDVDPDEYDLIVFKVSMSRKTASRLREQADAEGVTVRELASRLFREQIVREKEEGRT